MVFKEMVIKNIKDVTEPLKEQILKGDVHTIDEMKAWLKPLGYSDTINEAAINFILREFVMDKVSTDTLMNMDMVVESLRPQLEVTKEDIEPIIIMGLYHHRDLIGSRSALNRDGMVERGLYQGILHNDTDISRLDGLRSHSFAMCFENEIVTGESLFEVTQHGELLF